MLEHIILDSCQPRVSAASRRSVEVAHDYRKMPCKSNRGCCSEIGAVNVEVAADIILVEVRHCPSS